MSKWQKPITDRTATDILNRTSKAFFNIADWLRIHGNTEQVRLLLRLVTGIEAVKPDAVTISTSTFVSADAINDLVKTIDDLRQSVKLPPIDGIKPLRYDYIAGAGGTSPTYLDVNDWERDLELVRDCLIKIADYIVYCGVAAAGQPRHWQARYRRWAWVQPAAEPVRRPRTGLAICGTGMTRQNTWRKYG